jgi:flagellar hook-length control protein FliK
MKALANLRAVLLPQDSVRGKGAVRRTSAKPQRRFADAAALVGTEEQARADNSATGKAATNTKAVCEPSALVASSRKSRSTPDHGQAAVAAALSGHPAALLVRTGKDDAKLDSTTPPAAKVPTKEARESAEVKTPSGKAMEGPISADAVIHGQPSAYAVRTQPADVSQSSPGRPADAVIHAAGDTPKPHQDKPEVKASNPVSADTDRSSPQKPQEGAKQGETSIPQAEPQGVGKEEPVATAGQPIEHAEAPQAESVKTPPHVSPNAPFVARPLPKDDSTATVQKTDEMTPKASSTHEDQTVETPQKPRQSSQQVRREGQGPTAPKREDTLVRQHRQAEVTGPGDKKAEPELHADGAKAQMESSASAISPPAAVASRLSVETPVRGIVDIGTDPSAVRTVSEQILEGVRTSMAQGEGQISVRLQPPELGTITVRLRERGERLEGTVEVDKSDTRREIERALPEVVRGLQDAGIQVHKLDVTGGDSSGLGFGRGAWQQDGGFGHNGSGQSRDHLPASYTPGAPEAANYAAHSEEPAQADRSISVPPGRIDMLL